VIAESMFADLTKVIIACIGVFVALHKSYSHAIKMVCADCLAELGLTKQQRNDCLDRNRILEKENATLEERVKAKEAIIRERKKIRRDP